jgi:hypothetical protein
VDEIPKLDHQKIKLHEKLAASYRHFISNCDHAVRLINTTRRKQLQELHCISLHPQAVQQQLAHFIKNLLLLILLLLQASRDTSKSNTYNTVTDIEK